MTILTEEQIQSLFQFCKKHCVRYYDVQVELVDHLATSIEMQQTENPKLDFEKALQNVYKEFGVTGFGKYISEKEAQTFKMLAKERRQILFKLFTPPKIIVIIIGLIIILFPAYLRNTKFAEIMAISLCCMFPISNILFIIRYFRDKKHREKKIFLLDGNSAFSQAGLSSGGFYIALRSLVYILTNTNEMTFSFTSYTLLIIALYIASLVMLASWQQYKNLNSLVRTNYPNAFKN